MESVCDATLISTAVSSFVAVVLLIDPFCDHWAAEDVCYSGKEKKCQLSNKADWIKILQKKKKKADITALEVHPEKHSIFILALLIWITLQNN